ncbi:hypothetical protein, partial [Campylobacter troglodytis]|uniref:hypothetical protein n=1 Tax=Campylobacter troglodytis TaxID=654363 RepID=UPI001C8EC255
NIIFFAYTKENGKVHNLSYTQPPLPARIKTVQCIELKILKSRFHLRLYDERLTLLENERIILSLAYTKEVASFILKYTKTRDFKEDLAYKLDIMDKEEFISEFISLLSLNSQINSQNSLQENSQHSLQNASQTNSQTNSQANSQINSYNSLQNSSQPYTHQANSTNT